ncbi:LPXTG-motif cell wall anchor domain-containing protein/Listeria/Bacterioides repeat-containing protein [Lactococcus chungangensis CAU 28 = DSM 22330]|uniref:LPXTG-motif cell wall anchor domain-containing protein/Listeria/Bacterioides repeat-containing protein n=3 Tax=Pseudolactococcus chungangensis TaxID=451457 RepID=A0A1K2H8B2_9LACT|nr:LPXTG-motif cell wall anchor domain-containing protein/Listeria/Bacterioides repeat-containing protein [Lactococcus chungangensis CAU 28 = DSM 22330]
MMTRTLKKLSVLILALGMIFILSFPSIAHAADTGGSDHFELTVVENKDSKSGAEIADLTIKNISGKTGTNVTFEADLPTIFHDKDLKKVTVNVGTLKAGDAKTYQVSRKTDGTVTTTPLPTTGTTNTATKTSTSLPSTGEKMTPVLMVLGLSVLAAVLIIAIKHRKAAKNVLALVLLIAGLGSAATVNAAEKTYHHRDEVRNHAVELGGTTYVFHLAAEGDFENDATPPVTPTPVTYKMTFDSNGGSAVTPVTDIAEGATVTEPSAPSKTGYTFDGWYEQSDFSDTAWNFATNKMPAKDVTLYAKWTPTTYAISYELNGGTNYPSAITSYTIASQTITLGTPSKFGFVFDGWYDTANFDNVAVTDIATGSTGDKELYAKWSVDPAAPVTDGTPEIGETVTFAGTDWRILKLDMDEEPSNGNQALVIKEQALTAQETGDGNIMVQFDTTATNSTSPYFHDDSTSTGYGESHLKAVIDSYYNTSIAPTYSNYVLPVDLDLPNWSRYSDNILFNQYDSNLPLAYDNWYWQDWQSYYTDNRFPTSLAPLTVLKQQAFALSYGDIQSLDKSTFYDDNLNWNSNANQSDTGYYSTLLDFTAIDANYPYFWLRSAGYDFYAAGAVLSGSFFNGDVNYGLPVRPALAIQLS